MSEALDKLEEAIATAPDGVVKAYVTRDPKGRKAPLPVFEVRRDQPFEDQLWEHVLANATEGGPFEVRLRLDGKHLAQDHLPLEFKRSEPPRDPNPAPVAPVPAAPSLLDELRRLKAIKQAMRELDELDEPDEDDEDDEDDEELVEEDEDGGDDDEREDNPSPGVLGDLLGDETTKQAAAGLMLQFGDWLAKDAALKEAQAEELKVKAELARQGGGQDEKGTRIGRGTPEGAPRPRLVAVKPVEEGDERAAAAGDVS